MKAGGEGNSSELDEEERRALRGSKFAPLSISESSSSSSRSLPPRLAHPGGPVTTNKAAALAKFLERKLKQPGGLESINPDVLELAVKNAQETVRASRSSTTGRMVRHVASFEDGSCEESETKNLEKKKTKKKKKGKNAKKMKKKQEMLGVQETGNMKRNEKIERRDALERKKRKRKKKALEK